MFPQTYPQSDARVRELVAEGRRMFGHSPLSERELESIARRTIEAGDRIREKLGEELERRSVMPHPHPESSSAWLKIQPGLFMRASETSGHCASDAALQAYDAEYEKIKRRTR